MVLLQFSLDLSAGNTGVGTASSGPMASGSPNVRSATALGCRRRFREKTYSGKGIAPTIVANSSLSSGQTRLDDDPRQPCRYKPSRLFPSRFEKHVVASPTQIAIVGAIELSESSAG